MVYVQSMDYFVKKSCRFCLSVISDENFKVIEETIKEVLLLFKLNVEEMIEPVICSTCLRRLFEAFQFKATCLDTEDIIFPYINCENTPVNLQEIYLKERGKEHLRTLLEDERICRLCMQVYTFGFTSVQVVEIDMIQKCIPEIDFNSTKDPVICKHCLSLLETHSNFLKSCLGVDEQFESFQNDKKGSLCIKVEEIEIKSEENDENGDHDKRNLIGCISETTLNSSNTCDYKCKRKNNLFPYKESHKMLKLKDSSEFQMYKGDDAFDHERKLKYECDVCDYKANRKDHLIRHQLKHKSTSEVRMYICGTCDYKTKCKGNLVQHQRRHENISVVQKYECNICHYKANRKDHLIHHQLKHKSTSEVQMYVCDTCDFKTRWKDNFLKHQERHENISKVRKYECDVCDYKANRKNHLINHQLKHKSTSEVQMYVCDTCNFKTRWKSNFLEHQRRHENISDARKYECDVCDYKASRKYHLIRHQLKHKSTSEVQMFMCDRCDFKTRRKDTLARHQLGHENIYNIPVLM